jgi:hypothetical protein
LEAQIIPALEKAEIKAEKKKWQKKKYHNSRKG